MWSMYLIPETLRGLTPLSTEWTEALEDLPDSELKDQIAKWPHAAQHDGLNYVFVTTHPEALEPIDLTVAEYKTIDELISLIAKELFSADRSKAIHITKTQAVTLYAHPVWRLWCGNYKGKDELEADHELFFGVGVDRRKSLDTLIDESRAEIHSYYTN